jgi:antitoxin VapB
MAIVGVEPVSIDTANDLLVRWEHRLGPVHRPFRQEAYVLMVQDRPVSVATSGSIIHGPVAGYELGEVVELTRLASDPANRWATRPMLRLWREVCAQLWPCWPVKAAISYSHNGLHTGDLYRWDGWTRAATSSGSTGGGQWSRPRAADDPRLGSKSVWVWRYDRPAPLPVAVGTAATLGLDVARMALEGQA